MKTMDLSIRTSEEFHDYLERECQNAAEQGRIEGREEGEKIGEARGKISAVLDLYIAGFIARDVASAQLGVTDQEFETLLQSRS
ncbi:hypothetical protein [Succinimonas sp.]|uniref:hypothetical protein n=1 Tax=Succinimonas sp. TaxID=1936151 RepID=UPI003870D254